MTTSENNPAHQTHLLGAVLFVDDFATLAVEDMRGNDITGALHSLNHVALSTNRAIETLVTAAREDGTTWQMISDALQMTKQAAQQRFGGQERAVENAKLLHLMIEASNEAMGWWH
jgi:hypothetical protein